MALALILMIGLATLGLAAVTIGTSESNTAGALADQVQAEYLAEAAVREAVLAIWDGSTGAIGSRSAPALLGDGVFWVQATDMGSNQRLLEIRALKGSGRSALEVLVGTNDVTVPAGAFGDRSLVLDSQAYVDSYQSSMGTYASQAVNKRAPVTYSDAGGHAGSNGDIAIYSNAQVFGDAKPGPGGKVTINGNAYVSGETVASKEKTPLPPIEVPKVPIAGDYKQVDGDRTLPPGNYGFGKFEMDSTAVLRVKGPAVIVVNYFHIKSNSEFRADTSGGPVKIYALREFVMDSNTLVAPDNRRPGDLNVFINGTADMGDNELKSNDVFYGTMYAPYAPVVINSNSSIFGSVIARDLVLDSNTAVHIDMTLFDGENVKKVPTILSWQKSAMPAELTRSSIDPFKLLDVEPAYLLSPEKARSTETELPKYDPNTKTQPILTK